MDLGKIIENEIVQDNAYLESKGIKNYQIVDKISIGENKSIDFRNMDTGLVATVVVEGSCIKYDGRVINIPNMLSVCSKVLGIAL